MGGTEDAPVQVGPVLGASPGAWRRFTVQLHGVAWPALAVLTAQGWRGYLDRCRHLPLPLDSGPDGPSSDGGRTLTCSRHNARYDAASGACMGGACEGRALTALRMEERGGMLWCLGAV